MNAHEPVKNASIIRFRKWKAWCMPFLLFLGLWLTRGMPDESVRWKIAFGLAAVLAIVYIAEELVWMKLGSGRPCKHCHQMVPMRAFRLSSRCPTCGNCFD